LHWNVQEEKELQANVGQVSLIVYSYLNNEHKIRKIMMYKNVHALYPYSTVLWMLDPIQSCPVHDHDSYRPGLREKGRGRERGTGLLIKKPVSSRYWWDKATADHRTRHTKMHGSVVNISLITLFLGENGFIASIIAIKCTIQYMLNTVFNTA
jgi:hypothetical protein